MNFVMDRRKPHVLLAYEALFRRLLPRFHRNQTLCRAYFNYRAGFNGEKMVDYELALFSQRKAWHLPSLRLQNNANYFQIDSLILTPWVFFCIEIKNLKGTLEYNAKNRQLIQRTGEDEVGYNDPILQVKTQRQHLLHWLEQFDLKIPIEPIVVSANEEAIIRNIHSCSEFDLRFVPLKNVRFRLEDFLKKHSNIRISSETIRFLCRKLIEHNTPLQVDLVKQYNFKKSHFIKGISCEECQYFPLRRRRGWICPRCHRKKHNEVHKRALLDYFLLFNSAITNEEARMFLQVQSPSSVYNFLQELNLKQSGTNKGRKYFSPPLHQFPQNDAPKFLTPASFDDSRDTSFLI